MLANLKLIRSFRCRFFKGDISDTCCCRRNFNNRFVFRNGEVTFCDIKCAKVLINSSVHQVLVFVRVTFSRTIEDVSVFLVDVAEVCQKLEGFYRRFLCYCYCCVGGFYGVIKLGCDAECVSLIGGFRSCGSSP